MDQTLTDSNMEHEYTPSLWTDRFPSRDEVLGHHINFVRGESNKNRSKIPWVTQPYGNSERQAVDIFGTDLKNGTPITIYIHGGFWQELSREESSYPALALYNRGVKTAIVGYDLCPTVTLETIMQQVKAAVKHILRYAEETQAKNVIVSGHSAGAHLAAMAVNAINHQLLTGAVLISGIYDLLPITRTTNWINLGVNNEQDINKLSPIYQPFEHCSTLKVMVVIGEKESNEFKAQSRKLQDHLKKKNLHVQYDEQEAEDHFSVVEKLTEPDNYLVLFVNMLCNS